MLDLTDWQNKKYTTLRGTEVVILAIDAPGPQPIIGYLKHHSSDINGVTVCSWTIDGDFRLEGNDEMNLINAKTKREGWVNIAKLEHFISESDTFRSGYVTSGVFSSKEEADKHHFNVGWGVDRTACVRIEWEE